MRSQTGFRYWSAGAVCGSAILLLSGAAMSGAISTGTADVSNNVTATADFCCFYSRPAIAIAAATIGDDGGFDSALRPLVRVPHTAGVFRAATSIRVFTACQMAI
jgi:hypothetical protein